MELARNVMNFPNGASVVAITTGTPGAAPGDAPTGIAVVTTITQGPGGANPPGYPEAWPGAVLVVTP